MKHQHKSMELKDFIPRIERPCLDYFTEGCNPTKESNALDLCETQQGETIKVTL